MENTATYFSLSEAENYNASVNAFHEHFLDDVIAIENGHVREQLSAYLLESDEDNASMALSSLQKLAKSSGVKSAENISHKIELIWAIQMATYHQPCFGSEQRFSCQKQDCNWRYECKK